MSIKDHKTHKDLKLVYSMSVIAKECDSVKFELDLVFEKFVLG